MVNFSPTFPEVLKQFNSWLEGHELNSPDARVAVLTDGPWDMGRFLHQQCCVRPCYFHPNISNLYFSVIKIRICDRSWHIFLEKR